LDCAFDVLGKDLDEQDLMEFIWQDLDPECGRDIEFCK
jgi:hypothetical protein